MRRVHCFLIFLFWDWVWDRLSWYAATDGPFVPALDEEWASSTGLW